MDKRVLITAGGSGTGRTMAEAFDKAGAHVWAVDIDADALASCPPVWEREQLDVCDEAAVTALFARIRASWDGLDVLCANAGIADPTAPIEDIEVADWRHCLMVNLEGAFLFAKHDHCRRRAYGKSGPESAIVPNREARLTIVAEGRCRNHRGIGEACAGRKLGGKGSDQQTDQQITV